MLDESVVEEGHGAVLVEDVVARVRVTVELVHPVQAPEHEAEQHFGDTIAVFLRLLQNPRPRLTHHEFGRDHA